AGASDADAQHSYHFGVGVGIAFQLQDDILDVYGDPEQFGKQRGGDILANKKTYLLLKALEKADSETRAKLDRWLAESTQPSQKTEQVMGIYDLLAVRNEAEAAKQAYMEQAYTALERIDVADSRKAPLRELANTLLNR